MERQKRACPTTSGVRRNVTCFASSGARCSPRRHSVRAQRLKHLAQAQQPAADEWKQAEHPRHHGRRCRLVQHRRLSSRHHVGQDAEPRQARCRRHALHRLLCRGKLHGRPRQFHYRRNATPHGPDDRGPGRRRCRSARSGRDDRHRAEVAGLRDRAVRQEPSRRPEQVSSDGARLRRILRLSLPPRCHVRSVLVRLSAGLDRQDRTAQSSALLGHRHGRPDGEAALGQGRQAEDRG